MNITAQQQNQNKIDIYLQEDDLIPLSLFLKKKRYKWITFLKNGSHFITPFKNVKIYPSNKFTLYNNRGDEILIFNKFSLKIKHSSIITSFLLKGEYPENIIEINNGELFLPATEIERYIYSTNDFITKKIKTFSNKISTELSPGRVHIFGKNYIFLQQKNVDFL